MARTVARSGRKPPFANVGSSKGSTRAISRAARRSVRRSLPSSWLLGSWRSDKANTIKRWEFGETGELIGLLSRHTYFVQRGDYVEFSTKQADAWAGVGFEAERSTAWKSATGRQRCNRRGRSRAAHGQ